MMPARQKIQDVRVFEPRTIPSWYGVSI
jgi:hypothetical protein